MGFRISHFYIEGFRVRAVLVLEGLAAGQGPPPAAPRQRADLGQGPAPTAGSLQGGSEAKPGAPRGWWAWSWCEHYGE